MSILVDERGYFGVGGALKARGRADLGSGPPPPTSRFPGDLGPGRMYHGLSVNQTVDSPNGFETREGCDLGIYRRYYSNRSMADISPFTTDLATDLAADRLTWASFKLPGASSTGWQETINGDNDAWLVAIANAAAAIAPHPGWGCFHHEPKGEADPSSMFVAMFEHCISIVKPIAPNFAWGPILNGYAFAAGQGDPRQWDVPSADMCNYDQYDQWWLHKRGSQTNYESGVDSYHPWKLPSFVFAPTDIIQTWGKPCAIAEYGVHHPWATSSADDPDWVPGDPTPGMDVQWMIDGYQYALDHGSAALVYFNSGIHSPRGPWNMDFYWKPTSALSQTQYADRTRLDQFLINAAKTTSGFPSERV